MSCTVADDQFNDIISSEEAWTIVDPESIGHSEGSEDGNEAPEADYRPTMGARKVKALVEQVAGMLLVRVNSRSIR